MGNIIDMASFEHLRSQQKPLRYTCSKTGVTFPVIYKVLIPDAEMEGDQPVFTGEFLAYYQLKEQPRHGNSDLPGFPPSPATKISTLQAEDALYLDVLHFSNKDEAEGFKKACFHLGMEMEHVSWTESEQGAFVLLTREGNTKNNGHIIYRTSKNEFIEMLGMLLPCEYIAAFNSAGEIVPFKDIEDYIE